MLYSFRRQRCRHLMRKKFRKILRRHPGMDRIIHHHGNALAIAAAGGLQDGIKPGFFAVDAREIHIDTGFDERGGNDAAGQADF